MYISRITLKNIRGFDHLDLQVVEPDSGSPRQRKQPRMHTVVLGKNGTCKTTLLRCIAIGLSGQQDAAGMISESIGQLVQQGKKEAEVIVELTPVDDLQLRSFIVAILRNSEEAYLQVQEGRLEEGYFDRRITSILRFVSTGVGAEIYSSQKANNLYYQDFTDRLDQAIYERYGR